MIDEKKLIKQIWKKAEEIASKYGEFANNNEHMEAKRIDNIVEGMMDVIKIVENQEKIEVPYVNKWIPVSERLPEMHKVKLEDDEYYMISDSVLITDGNSVCMSEYEIDDEERYGWLEHDYEFSGEVTHWMPLPEPYMQADHETKKQTNAEWIRSMTDEELSSFLNKTVFEEGQNLFLCEDYIGTSVCEGCQYGNCKAYLHWLRKEVEE